MTIRDAQVVVLLDTAQRIPAYYLVQHDNDLNNFASYQEGINKWSSPQVELDTSDPQTLIVFGQWVIQNFPSQHYALILDGHGSGMMGAMSEEHAGIKKIMNVKQIYDALKTITENGKLKFDILVMNACLMGMIEDAYEWHSMMDYYVSSENIQNTYFAGYTAQVNLALSTTSPAQYAVDFADSYANDPDISTPIALSKVYYTISVADMSKIDGLISSINGLATEIERVDDATALSQVIDQVQRFNNIDSELKSINKQDTYADLYDFSRLVKALFQDQNVKDAAQSVMTEIESNYIIYNRHAILMGVDNSHGVSILLPNIRSSYYTGINYAFAADTVWFPPVSMLITNEITNIGWGDMLANYFTITQPNGPDDPTPPDAVARPQSFFSFIPMIRK